MFREQQQGKVTNKKIAAISIQTIDSPCLIGSEERQRQKLAFLWAYDEPGSVRDTGYIS